MEPEQERESKAALPLLNARTWALSFLVFAVVLAIVFSQFLIDFMGRAH
jgi:ubiquinone biosynthesis protein UbiJ